MGEPRPFLGPVQLQLLTASVVEAGVVMGSVATTGVRPDGRPTEVRNAVPTTRPFPTSVAHAGLGVASVA